MKPKALTGLLVMVLFLTIGCAGSGGPSNPVVPGSGEQDTEIQLVNPVENRNSGHLLLSYNMIYVDATNPNDVQVEMVPVRVGSMHLNILKLLEVSLCNDCFGISGISISEPGILDVDIDINHPLNDVTYLLFDVRGIMMFDGSHIFPVSGLTVSDSSLGDGELLNAEGYTQLYNGPTLGMAGDLFTYYQGNYATEVVPNSLVNGFMRHITDHYTNTRNALFLTNTITRTYRIAMPSSEFVFGYAVDASWDMSDTIPVEYPMLDFPDTANCIEPWKIEVTESYVGGGLLAEGGQIKLEIKTYDWTGNSTHGAPVVECPELFDGVLVAEFLGAGSTKGYYDIIISNEKLAPAGDYFCLIRVEDNENLTSPDYLDLTAYQVYKLSVFDLGDIVYFPDPVLEQKVRGIINIPEGDIYQGYLLGFKSLKFDYWPIWLDTIKDLEGIQYFTNVENLIVNDNEISDLTPLQSMIALTSLEFKNNDQIADLSPLENLSGLTYLDLYSSYVTDITPLQNLSELTYLSLGDNQITDITPLQNLVKLEYLSLWNNQVTDLTPLQNLLALEDVILSHNEISDIYPLVLNSDFGGLGADDDVRITDNPLSEDSLYLYIPILVANGVYVYWG